jgi:hypothetical protein
MFVVLDGVAAGLVSVAAPVKEATTEALRAMHAPGGRSYSAPASCLAPSICMRGPA